MPDTISPLTNAQIRTALNNHTAATMRLHLDLLVLQKALLKAKILTESDIAEATKEVKLEGDQHMAKLADAIRKGPVGGIQ